MKRKSIVIIQAVCAIFFLTPLLANAQGKKAFKPKVSNGAMRAAQGHLKGMVGNLIAGDFQAVAVRAGKMQKKSLVNKAFVSKEDDQAQAAKFLALNDTYEKAVKNMSQAAEARDEQKVFQQYTAITQSCMKCHAAFARRKFSKFQKH